MTPRTAERFLLLNLMQLRMLGVWRARRAVRLFSLMLVTCMASLLVGDLRLCYLAGSDLQELSKAVSFLMAHSMSFTKWAFLFRNRHNLEGILADMNSCVELGFRAKGGGELAAIETYGKSVNWRWRLAKWINSCWFLMLTYTMVHWCISVLFVRIPVPPSHSSNVTEYATVFPLGDWQLVDSRHSPEYESIFFVQSFAALGHAWSHSAFDGLYATLAIFLCGCFEFLADIMLKVGDDAGDLRATIKFHQALLRVAKDVDNMFSFIMFVQMINLVLALCTYAFQASTVDEDGDTNLVSALQVVSCGVTQLFIFCTFATDLTWMSWKVANSAYASDWIEKPLPWKRSIQMVMDRGQRPLRLTGGAFYFICLETLVAILQLSFSYFMVLRTLHENNQQSIQE